MLENAVFGLVVQCLENLWTEFHQTVNVDALWDKGERISYGQRLQHDPLRAQQAEAYKA